MQYERTSQKRTMRFAVVRCCEKRSGKVETTVFVKLVIRETR